MFQDGVKKTILPASQAQNVTSLNPAQDKTHRSSVPKNLPPDKPFVPSQTHAGLKPTTAP